MPSPRKSPHSSSRRKAGAVVAAGALGLTGLLTTALAPVSEAAASTCLTGTLKYTAPNPEAITTFGRDDLYVPNATSVVRNANLEIWGATTASGTPKFQHGGITSASDGTFNVCAPVATLYKASVKFSSESTGMWRVIDPSSRKVHTFTKSATNANVSDPALSTTTATGTKALGVVSVPTNLAGAWKIVDTVNDLYFKAPLTSAGCFTSTCTELTYTWNSSASEGGYWLPWVDTPTDPHLGEIVLRGIDANSKHTIVHEAGHWLMWQLYGGVVKDVYVKQGRKQVYGWTEAKFPYVEACDPHYVDTPSSVSCAWTEGFADAVAGYVLGDRSFVSSEGERTAFGPYRGGDTTQGNIGAALLDLWNGDWSEDYNRLAAHVTSTFDSSHQQNVDLGGPATFRDYIVNYRKRTAADLAVIKKYGIVY